METHDHIHKGAPHETRGEIEMSEFVYGCDLPEIAAGTVVALQFKNNGLVDHEAVVGDQAAQDDAELAMRAMLVVRLGEPGELTIGCHIEDHWDAGMHAVFEVSDA